MDEVAPGPKSEEERQRDDYENHKKDFDEEVGNHGGAIRQYKTDNAEHKFKTEFTNYDLKTIKSMVAREEGSDLVRGVADAWDQVHDALVGGAGESGGGAYGDLKRAVENTLEHWEGDSAESFRGEANKLLRQISNSASHCTTVSEALGGAATDYSVAHRALKAIEEPDWFDKAMDFIGDNGDREEKITAEAVKNRDIPKDILAKADEGYIGEEKELQLQAANHMETLARNYVKYADRMESSRKVGDGKDPVPPSEPTVPMSGPMPMPSGSARAPSGSGQGHSSKGIAGGSGGPATSSPRDAGITGGVPSAQTKVDSMPAGLTGSGADDVGGGSLRGSGAGAGVGSTSGSGAAGGALGGGMMGGGAAAGGAAGGGASGRPGMGGMGGGAGAGAGRGGASAGGRGALARATGGTVGAPRGISGGTPATAGGTGLGKGRGGSSSSGGRGMGGMLGGARGGSQRPGDEGSDQGSRPDYLVEDEETWAPEDSRSVPKNID